jgi:hypothetical protein
MPVYNPLSNIFEMLSIYSRQLLLGRKFLSAYSLLFLYKENLMNIKLFAEHKTVSQYGRKYSNVFRESAKRI